MQTEEVLDQLAARASDAHERWYVGYHRRRYRFLLERVDALRAATGAPSSGEGLRILDVGPYLQTAVLRARYPEAIVNSAGQADPELDAGGSDHSNPGLEGRAGERHFEVDLNALDDPGRVPALPEHDIAVMAEVIEHLYSAPAVLAQIARWLRPGGHLVLQTPNAVALHKRLRILAGRSPCSVTDHGHIHEFMVGELTDAAAEAGFDVDGVWLRNYFERPGVGGRFWTAVGPVLPPKMRHGITLSLTKRS